MKIMRHIVPLLMALALLAPAARAEAPEELSSEPAERETEESAPGQGEWNLLLVNPWTPLPEDFSVELVKLSNGMQVDKRVHDSLEDMLAACQEAGLRPVICSAYRTQAVQTRLYNNKISRLRAAGYSRDTALKEAGRWVAVPGTSEHQTGMALDIVSAGYQVLNRRQENTAEQKWLMEHCWEYGFILRYPSEKCEITGIGYEPWHYRYVGKEAALAMRDSGQCLEEYLLELEKESEQENNRPADGGPVSLQDGEASIQGDGAGVRPAAGEGEHPVEGMGVVPDAAGV